MDVGAGEDRPRGVRRIPRLRAEAETTRIEARHGDVTDGLLAAEHGNHLRRRIELDTEPVAVEGCRCLTKLGGPVIRRVPMRLWVTEAGRGSVDDRVGRREVGIADREADDVDALTLLCRDLALQLGEEVRRHLVETARELHSNSTDVSPA